MCSVEPLEGRILFALATLTGGGYSGTLSTNTSIRQQQLLCDPAEPKEGSTSVLYDPKLVHLSGYEPGPGYDNLGFIGFVEVRPWGQTTGTVLQPLVAFLQNPLGTETGYAQVHYQLQGQAGQLPVAPGFTVVDNGGVDGVDTHAFFFTSRPGVPVGAIARYQVFASRAGTHANNQEDYLLTNDGTNTRLGPANLTPAFVSTDTAPTITSTGGPYTCPEGSSLALHAAATDKETPGSLTYAWDLNGDGKTDATGTAPVVSAATLQSLGLGDGPKSVNIRLTVGDGDKTTSVSVPLTVTNVAPTAAVTSADGSLGTSTSLKFSATDPSAADAAAGFKYVVNWGDGTAPQTIAATANNGAGLVVKHTYSKVGAFAVTVTATDKDGGVSAPASAAVAIRGAQLRPDPSYPTKLALYVVGSNGPDTIRFAKAGNGTTVTINGVSAGTFSGFGRIIAFGLGGNDDIALSYQAASQVLFFGGEGDDKLTAGNCLTILDGGAGNDTLSSGNAKDLLVGGAGADHLNGGDGDDVLVAGRTSYDAGTDSDVRALTAILNEWVSGNTYETRIAHITGALPGGLNGSSLFNPGGPGQTVFDDGALDNLIGGSGRDWMLLKLTGPGVLDWSDLSATEIGTGL